MTPRRIKRATILEDRRASRRGRKIRRSRERQHQWSGLKQMTPNDIRRDIARQIAHLNRQDPP